MALAKRYTIDGVHLDVRMGPLRRRIRLRDITTVQCGPLQEGTVSGTRLGPHQHPVRREGDQRVSTRLSTGSSRHSATGWASRPATQAREPLAAQPGPREAPLCRAASLCRRSTKPLFPQQGHHSLCGAKRRRPWDEGPPRAGYVLCDGRGRLGLGTGRIAPGGGTFSLPERTPALDSGTGARERRREFYFKIHRQNST